MSIELPLDAEGREIPLDTKVLYSLSGEEHKVDEFTYDEPLRCQNCAHNVPRDRREDFGDVCERWCEKCNRWLAWLDEPPCEKGRK